MNPPSDILRVLQRDEKCLPTRAIVCNKNAASLQQNNRDVETCFGRIVLCGQKRKIEISLFPF
jgi:hypothetical protein